MVDDLNDNNNDNGVKDNDNNNKNNISRRQFLKLLIGSAVFFFASLTATSFGVLFRQISQLYNHSAFGQETKTETSLMLYPIPGYPIQPANNPTKFGIPDFDSTSGTTKEPPRGIPWGHTIVIKGKLHIKGKHDKGIQGKEIWPLSSDGPAPYPEVGRIKVAVTKKNGKFVTFMRNMEISLGSSRINNQTVVTFKRGYPFSLTLYFSAPLAGDAGADPSYKMSDRATVEYHSLTHRTSITVEVDQTNVIEAGQPITFTATLRDEDGVFMRDGINRSIYDAVEDVDLINILADPLQSVLVHELEGRVIEFSGSGIVPIIDEEGEQITTAITDKSGKASFKSKAPNTVATGWTYQAHYKAEENEHMYLRYPNKETKEAEYLPRNDKHYFRDASSIIKNFSTRGQKVQLLAGPMLRRSEPKRVCIWIATSYPLNVDKSKAEIYPLDDIKKSNNDNSAESNEINLQSQSSLPKPIGIASNPKSIQLGDNLYVTLFEVKPLTSQFPTAVLLAYDLEVYKKESDSVGYRLKDFGLLEGQNSIVLNGMPLPTFFLQGDLYNPNLLHGSCRKLHGPDNDCLQIADELISKYSNNILQRPSVLFLTGDQIYADDVGAPIIKYLTKFGIELLGYEEQIPDIGKLTTIQSGKRGEIVRNFAKFTSTHADNHLLGFGEFAAMYLVAWNGQNLPNNYDEFPPVGTIPVNEYLRQKQNLDNARLALPAVRRVLANIPTYMIFDDHEITDDWNLTPEWRTVVYGSNSGRRIIANGLVAFWAFQAWGNDPDMYKMDFLNKVSKYLDDNRNRSLFQFEQFILSFTDWAFYAPTRPPTIFLDTRTQRAHNPIIGPVPLINEGGLQKILQIARQANHKEGQRLIIVSPAPVYGYEFVESIQDILSKLSDNGQYSFDLEAWRSNEQGFINFITSIIERLGPSYCIFLSGDVHYAFSIYAEFTLNRSYWGNSVVKLPFTLPIVQLTSSSLKNTGLGNVAVGKLSIPTGHWRQEKPFDPVWKEHRAYIMTSPVLTSAPVIGNNNLGFVQLQFDKVIHQLYYRQGNLTKSTAANIKFI